MDIVEVVKMFAQRGCRFVVVGSAARALLGESVRPRDVDIVVETQLANRARVVAALDDLGGRVQWRSSWVPVSQVPALPWVWGWRNRTLFGEVDVVARFIDGTSFEDHDDVATPVSLPSGELVQCRSTRRAE